MYSRSRHCQTRLDGWERRRPLRVKQTISARDKAHGLPGDCPIDGQPGGRCELARVLRTTLNRDTNFRVAVGISRGTLYQYFRDKQSFLRALVDEQVEQIQHFVEPIDWQASDFPEPERVLSQRLLRIFELIHDHQDVFRLMVREARVRNPAASGAAPGSS